MKPEELIVSEGVLPIDLDQREACLKLPFYAISEDEYNRLIQLLVDRKTDILIDVDSGQKVTIGEVNGQYYIMPLKPFLWIGINENALSEIAYHYLFVYFKYF